MTVPTDMETIRRAREQYHDEGRIEVDLNAVHAVSRGSRMVSRAEDNEERGAYVQAWAWVPDPEETEEEEREAIDRS